MATTKRSSEATTRAKATPAEPASKTEATPKKTRARSARAPKTSPVTEVPVAPPPAAAPRPPQRMVFIDVENTSSESELLRVLDELAIRDLGATCELTAIGNWRVVAQGLGRSLAARGANLVHSAPAVRVSDWSDLWIAVHAGIWLGRAQPGDSLEIVSHDRAFDAVGDAASRLGVSFRRITYRGHPSPAEREPGQADATATASRGGRRRGGRGRRSPAQPVRAPLATPAAASAHPAPRPSAPLAPVPAAPEGTAASHDGGEPHSASHEQIRAIIARLTASEPSAGVGLDRLTVALKAAGFQRPPGSPRLVTRLRRMSDLEVLPSGRVRLRSATSHPHSHAHAHAHAPKAEGAVAGGGEVHAESESPAGLAAAPSDGVIDVTGTPSPSSTGTPRPRSRRRGGRRRRGSGSNGAGSTPAPETPSSDGV